jgi:hypothetical protein
MGVVVCVLPARLRVTVVFTASARFMAAGSSERHHTYLGKQFSSYRHAIGSEFGACPKPTQYSFPAVRVH